MFGFGNRRKYNGAVDEKLNNDYQITTRGNQYFPSSHAYLELIDNAWTSKMSEDEGAIYIATLHCCGLLRHEIYDEAKYLYLRILHSGIDGVRRGVISQARWEKFSIALSQAQREAGIE